MRADRPIRLAGAARATKLDISGDLPRIVRNEA
jgi:hypothetical protein